VLRKFAYALAVLIVLLPFWPFTQFLWAVRFARAHGCTLHDSVALDCIVEGVNRGEQLFNARSGVWLALVLLIPSLAAMFAIFVMRRRARLP
jgi:hypothetical protein